MSEYNECSVEEFLEQNLKPCPFCGRKPKNVGITFGETGVEELNISCCMEFRITVDDIYRVDPFVGESTYHRLELDPIQKWNRRAE